MANEELVREYQKGNKQALESLIKRNTGIIYKLINRFFYNSYEKEDLFQIGCLGLIKAAEKYDFNNPKKATFATYAAYYINGYIQRYLHNNNTNKEVSLDTPVGEDEENTLKDILPDSTNVEENCIERLYNMQLRKDLYSSMEKVNTLKERQILIFNYGLNNTEPMELKEVGEVLGINYNKTRQTKVKALRKLRYSPVYFKYKPEIQLERNFKKYKNVNSLVNYI